MAELEAVLKPGGRVVYSGNGMTGELVEIGVGTDTRGPIFSRVLFDGRDFASLVKTEYLDPCDTPAMGPALPVHPLDALENALPLEDLTGAEKVPMLTRALVIASIHQARSLERIAEGLARNDSPKSQPGPIGREHRGLLLRLWGMKW